MVVVIIIIIILHSAVMRITYLCKESNIQMFVPLRSVGSKDGTRTGLVKGNIQD